MQVGILQSKHIDKASMEEGEMVHLELGELVRSSEGS